MTLAQINNARNAAAAAMESEAERDAAAIRRAAVYRIKPLVRRRDSRDRVRPRPAA